MLHRLSAWTQFAVSRIVAAVYIRIIRANSGGESIRQLTRVSVDGKCVTVFSVPEIPFIRNAAAVTIGDTILVLDKYDFDWVKRHELTHVCQQLKYGIMYSILYAYDLLTVGYEDNRFEREARTVDEVPCEVSDGCDDTMAGAYGLNTGANAAVYSE